MSVRTEPNAEFFSCTADIAFILTDINDFIYFPIMVFIHIPIYPDTSFFFYNKIKNNRHLYNNIYGFKVFKILCHGKYETNQRVRYK